MLSIGSLSLIQFFDVWCLQKLNFGGNACFLFVWLFIIVKVRVSYNGIIFWYIFIWLFTKLFHNFIVTWWWTVLRLIILFGLPVTHRQLLLNTSAKIIVRTCWIHTLVEVCWWVNCKAFSEDFVTLSLRSLQIVVQFEFFCLLHCFGLPECHFRTRRAFWWFNYLYLSWW